MVRPYATLWPACAVTAPEDAIPRQPDANAAAGSTMRGRINECAAALPPSVIRY